MCHKVSRLQEVGVCQEVTWSLGSLCSIHHGQNPHDAASRHPVGRAQLLLAGHPPASPQAVRLEAYEGAGGRLHNKCHAEVGGAQKLMTPHQPCWGAWGGRGCSTGRPAHGRLHVSIQAMASGTCVWVRGVSQYCDLMASRHNGF